MFQVQIVTADVVVESSGVGSQQERHRSSAIMGTQVDIEQLTSANGFSDVGVSCALGQITKQDRPLALTLVEGAVLSTGRPSRRVGAMVVMVGLGTTTTNRA